MGWDQILSAIEERHSFLDRYIVHFSTSSAAEKIPPTIKICIGAASGIAADSSSSQRLLWVFPKAFDSAVWISIGYALEVMKSGFMPALEQLEPFSKGQRLLLDARWVVEFDGEEAINGQRFMWIRMQGKHGLFSRQTFPLGERLRFQSTTTKRPLTPAKHVPTPPPHALDQILEIKTYGNRTIFNNKVILVSRLGRMRDFASMTHVRPSKSKPDMEQEISLLNLFQWGGIDQEGTIESWGAGQVDAEPVLAVARDLTAARMYIRGGNNSSPPTVILEGSNSFCREIDALDEILDAGCPVLSVMERGEVEYVDLLAQRAFGIWVWLKKDLKGLETLTGGSDPYQPNASFAPFNRARQNFVRQRIEEHVCTDDLIQSAAENLEILDSQLNQNQPEKMGLVGHLYGCLLRLSSLVRPVLHDAGTSWAEKLSNRVEQIESEVIRNTIWLGDDAVSTARGLLDDLRGILASNGNPEVGKVEELRKLIKVADSREHPIAVVVGHSDEVAPAEGYWKSNLGELVNVDFCFPSTIDMDTNYSQIIICGWLGAKKMHQLVHSFLAPETTVLVYPFERSWFQSAKRKWNSESPSGLNATEKAMLLRLDAAVLSPDDGEEEDELSIEEPTATFDIDDFELRVRSYIRAAYATAGIAGESTVEARLAVCSDGRFVFLTDSYKVSVVTDIVTGKAGESDEIPRKTIADLVNGDYVLFREGSQEDLLREIADHGLEQAGKGHLRQVAGLWKKALKEFVDSHDLGVEEAWALLWLAGLERTEFTIRHWLTDEDIIGPRRHNDLEIIANVTNNAELKTRLAEVGRAITEVRGAHLQASNYLAKRLLSEVPKHLGSVMTESITVDLEGIGTAVIARVEDIAEELTTVAFSKANRLLQEESDVSVDAPTLF